jgi:hypothetical protein
MFVEINFPLLIKSDQQVGIEDEEGMLFDGKTFV